MADRRPRPDDPDADPVLAAVGRNIARFRAARRLSQRDLAEKAEVQQVTVLQSEHGLQNLTLKTASKIAAALDVELWELVAPADVGRQPIPSPSPAAVPVHVGGGPPPPEPPPRRIRAPEAARTEDLDSVLREISRLSSLALMMRVPSAIGGPARPTRGEAADGELD